VTWVFVFLGEFGYELLNWQGVVRGFSRTLEPGERIVCVSRAQLEPLYESADRYIDISELAEFKQSVASGYFARDPRHGSLWSPQNLVFDFRLRQAVRRFVEQQEDDRPLRFVFSSSRTDLGGRRFGASRRRWGRDPHEGDIYAGLNLRNNEFSRIEPAESARAGVEDALGIDLDQPYVLCQARDRDIVRRSDEHVPKDRVIAALAGRLPVVLLSFDTGRALDSYSAFADLPGCRRFAADGFAAQSVLVAHAKHCVFFTEGDFGSHIYVPPFLGRDVHVIAPDALYEVGTTPIDFWNDNVFRFGGQIVPLRAEQVLASDQRVAELADDLAR
jgi:hypothetical protein